MAVGVCFRLLFCCRCFHDTGRAQVRLRDAGASSSSNGTVSEQDLKAFRLELSVFNASISRRFDRLRDEQRECAGLQSEIKVMASKVHQLDQAKATLQNQV